MHTTKNDVPARHYAPAVSCSLYFATIIITPIANNGNGFPTVFLQFGFTGPVLVKNPALTDLVIARLFTAKGWEVPNVLPRLPHEQEAYEVTLRELQARVK